MPFDVAQRKRWFGYTNLIALYLFLTVLALAGAWLIYVAITVDDTIAARLAVLALAGMCLSLPGLFLWMLLCRKRETGIFRLSPRERAAHLAGSRARYDRRVLLWLGYVYVVIWLVIAAIWITEILVRPHHSVETIIYPCLALISAGVSIYNVLRPSSGSSGKSGAA